MRSHPLLWRLIVRRLRLRLPGADCDAVLGDLIEDYRTGRRARGWLRAEWQVWRDARSISEAYTSPRYWGDGLRFDMRLAARSALRRPGLTLAIVIPLAFAVAANTSLFSIVDGLLFRPLPFRDTNRLMTLQRSEAFTVDTSYQAVVALINSLGESPLLDGAAVAAGTFAFPASAVADAGITPRAVSPRFFELVDIPLLAGRDIAVTDNEEGSPLAAVIGHGVWQRDFGGNPDLVGRVVSLAGRSVEIIGIARPGMTYPIGADVWVPSGPPVSANMTRFWSVGRLAPGVSIEAFRNQYPDVTATPLREAIQPKDTASIVFLLGATALFLLAAWVQLGALLLGRTVSRMTEVGVRIALGAGPGRLRRQFLLDSAVLAGLALILAWLVTPFLTTFLAAQLPRQMTVGQLIAPDLRTFMFAAAVSVLGAGLLAIAPLGLLRRIAPALLMAGGTSGVTIRAERTRGTLLVAQIACSTLLLCVAGLAFHSFVRISNADVGFEPDRLWEFSIPSLRTDLSDDERAAARLTRQAEAEAALAALRGLPDVAWAGAGSASVLSNGFGRGSLGVGGKSLNAFVGVNAVTPGFLQALNPRLHSGRLPDPDAVSDASSAFIVNRALARSLASSAEGIDRVMSYRGRVAGVIDDLVNTAPGVAAEPHAFIVRRNVNATVLLVRTRSGESGRAALETTLTRFWGPGAGARLSPVGEMVATLTAPWRARTVLFGLIAILCVPLVVTGIAGALYAAVRARTREIAVRLALGAETRTVHRTIVGRALSLAALGVAAGLAGGVAVGYLMSSQLYGVRPADAATLASVTAVVLLVAWLAALLPARLASTIAPAEALKER